MCWKKYHHKICPCIGVTSLLYQTPRRCAPYHSSCLADNAGSYQVLVQHWTWPCRCPGHCVWSTQTTSIAAYPRGHPGSLGLRLTWKCRRNGGEPFKLSLLKMNENLILFSQLSSTLKCPSMKTETGLPHMVNILTTDDLANKNISRHGTHLQSVLNITVACTGGDNLLQDGKRVGHFKYILWLHFSQLIESQLPAFHANQ